MTTGDSEGPNQPPKKEELKSAKSTTPTSQEDELTRLAKLSDIRDDLEEKREPETQIATPKAKDDESVNFAELLEKQRKLIQEAISNGQSLLLANRSGMGMQYINPADRGPFQGDRYALPKHWRSGAVDLLSTNGHDLGQTLSRDGIYETVVIKPATRDVLDKHPVTRSVEQRGLFGKRYVDKVVQEDYVAGQKPLTMAEATGIESTDPAYGIYYYAYDGNDNSLPAEGKYRDFIGRPGNSLDLKIVVPQNIASQISGAIREDPGFIRKLTYRLIRQKYPKDFVQGDWENFDQPPYQIWEKHTQPKLYLVDMMSEPSLDKEPTKSTDYDKTKVISFSTKVVNGASFGIPK